MTVAVQDPINQFVIVGGETSGPWTWQLNQEADLTVFKKLASTGEVLTLVLDTDYSVNALGLGNKNGGTITFLAAQLPAVTGDVWTLQRDSELSRPEDFATSGDFQAVTVNPQFDDPILMAQDAKREATNALRKNPGVDDVLDPLIPQPVSGRALKFAESTPGNFILTMSETDPDDGSVKTVAGLFATSISTPSNLVVQESQDGFEVRVDTSSGDVDITLPDSTALSLDFRVGIVKTTSDSNVVNVKVQGTDTINGGTADFVEDNQFTRIIFVLDQPTGAYLAGLDKVGIRNVIEDTSPQLGGFLDTNGFPINTSRLTVASNATTSDIWASPGGNEIDFTGVEEVTAFPAAPLAGSSRILFCAAACSFVNSANLVVQGGGTFTAAAGDKVMVHAETTTKFLLFISKADGTAVAVKEKRVDLYTGTVLSTSSTGIPQDNSIPQNTEGTAYGAISLAIAPLTVADIVTAEVNLKVGASANSVYGVFTLFSSLSADAIDSATSSQMDLSIMTPVTLRAKITATQTSPITFTIRFAAVSAGTIYINRSSSDSNLFGGGKESSIVLTSRTP